MRKLILPRIAAGMLRTLATLAFVSVGMMPASAQTNRFGPDYFSNLPVVDQHGRTLRFYDDVIRGKIVVISFIYTSCRDICPLVTARLAQVEEKLGELAGKEVHFVSISIDPENDTPQKLKEHADAFRVGPGWQFLTGKRDDIAFIRHKLGERSRSLGEHRNEIVLGNDRTGDWSRDSAFTDINVLTMTIRGMDPVRREAAARNLQQDKTSAILDTDVLPGQALFSKACVGCHTIGKGPRIGPDLAGVTDRRDRAWLANFMIAPEAMRARNDPIAVELGRTYKTVRMPTLGLSEDDAADLIGYLEFQSYRLTAPTAATPAAQGAHHAHEHHHH